MFSSGFEMSSCQTLSPVYFKNICFQSILDFRFFRQGIADLDFLLLIPHLLLQTRLKEERKEINI